MIPQQSINWINEAIEITNTMIAHYENPDNTDRLHPCPYCEICGECCQKCPYQVIFNTYCRFIWKEEFAEFKKNSYSEFAISRAKHLRKRMLPKLRKLKRELEKNEQK